MWFNNRLKKRKISVIILDDNEQIKASFRQSIDNISNRAYVINCTHDDELWSALKTTDFDLLIVDSKLYGVSSLELIREVKNKYKQMKVLGLYTHSNDPLKELLFNAGADSCISKFDVQKRSLKKALKKMEL